jgi:hypothetical protein
LRQSIEYLSWQSFVDPIVPIVFHRYLSDSPSISMQMFLCKLMQEANIHSTSQLNILCASGRLSISQQHSAKDASVSFPLRPLTAVQHVVSHCLQLHPFDLIN